MFSRRFPWGLQPNRLTALLEQRRRRGEPVLDLTESNPTRAGLSYPAGAIEAALADARALRYEPSPAGLPEARAAVARYYAARGCPVDVSAILLTASTSEAYAYLFKLLADPGDEVLVPRPSYPLFEFLAAMESIRVSQYPLAYHGGWSLDVEALASAVTPRTRAIIVVHPNNPTGSFLKREELQALLELCAARGLPLLADEVFADYAFAADPRRVPTLAVVEEVPAFVMSGLSKVAGLPQLKLGWIVAAGPAAARAEAFARLEWIADTYLSVGTPVQHAASRLLELAPAIRGAIAARTQVNLDSLRGAVGPQSPARVLEVEGGWYGIVQVPRTRREEEWALDLLAGEGVLVQPGFFYDFDAEAYLVLSLLTEPSVFQEGVRRLLARAAA